MATSSITANFHTDDPKAANAIVHALFSDAQPTRRPAKRRCRETRRTPAGDRAFFRQLAQKAQAMKADA